MGICTSRTLNVGEQWASPECPVDHEEMPDPMVAPNDPWPIHVNPEAAATSAVWRIYRSGGYTISPDVPLSHEIVNQPDPNVGFLGTTACQVSRTRSFSVTNCTNASQFWRALSSSRDGAIVKHLIELINDPKACVLSIESSDSWPALSLAIATHATTLANFSHLTQRRTCSSCRWSHGG